MFIVVQLIRCMMKMQEEVIIIYYSLWFCIMCLIGFLLQYNRHFRNICSVHVFLSFTVILKVDICTTGEHCSPLLSDWATVSVHFEGTQIFWLITMYVSMSLLWLFVMTPVATLNPLSVRLTFCTSRTWGYKSAN